MTEDYDSSIETVTDLADGDSITVEVETDSTEVSNVVLFVDDDAGNAPATYDVTAEVYRTDPDPAAWFYYADEAGTTARSLTDPAYSQKMKYTITNRSGGPADFRAILVAFEGE